METNDQRFSNTSEDLFADLIYLIWKKKLFICLFTFLTTALGVIVSLNIENSYESEAILTKSSFNSKGLNLSGGLGSVASLAGIDLGGGDVSKVDIALEIIKSKAFLERLINKYDVLIDLHAIESFSFPDKVSIYDSSIYDLGNNEWVRDVTFPKTIIPSIEESHTQYLKDLKIREDSVSGLVFIAFESHSPHFAKKMVDIIIKEINELMRAQEVDEAEKSILYLEERLSNETLGSLKETLFVLAEEQERKKMMAIITPDFIFKIIEPARISYFKSKPNRLMFVLLSLFIGILLSVLFIMLNKALKAKK